MKKLSFGLISLVLLILLSDMAGATQFRSRYKDPYANLLLGRPQWGGELCHGAASYCLSDCSANTPINLWGACRQQCRAELNTCRLGHQSLYERQQNRLDDFYRQGGRGEWRNKGRHRCGKRRGDDCRFRRNISPNNR